MGIRKSLVVCVLGAAALGPAASHGYGMTDFYNEAGVYANITGPGAYRGQTMGLFTGGNMFVRVPQRTYQLASVAGPNLKAGCGGIDLFAGSFSYINEAQFVALLKNTLQVAWEECVRASSDPVELARMCGMQLESDGTAPTTEKKAAPGAPVKK